MRKALLGAIALILVSAALAKSSFDGVMTISYGFFTDADGRRISLVGREVPFTIEPIELGAGAARPTATVGTDAEVVYSNDHGTGSYIASALAMPSALDDIIMVNGANATWQSFTVGMNYNSSSTAGSVFLRWTGYSNFTPGQGAGVMAFSNPLIDFGGNFSLALLVSMTFPPQPPPGAYKLTFDVSPFSLSVGQNQMYFVQQFRDGNQNGPFRMEFDNIFSIGFPNPGSSQESFYFDFEPNGIFDETEIEQWPVGSEANMLLKIEANPSGVVETRPPSSHSFQPGVEVSGSLADLWDSDDFYLVGGPGIVFSTANPPIRLVLTSTSTTTSPTQVAMQVEGKSTSASIQQQVEFWNYQTNAWVLADTRNTTTSDTSIQVIAPGTASHYVHQTSRQIQTRLSYKAQGPVFVYPWRVSWDQAVWRITRP